MKSITYVNRNDSDKVTMVKSIALFNKIKLDNVCEEQAKDLPDNAEILIMRGFSRNEMTKFLSDLKKRGIKINLKCVETETNKMWSLAKLYEEIKKEHEVMQNMQID